MGELDDFLTDTLRSAPELNQAPWAAVPVAKQSAQSGHTKLNAQGTAHVTNMTAHRKAQDESYKIKGNLFQKAVGIVGWAAQHNPIIAKPANTVKSGEPGYETAKESPRLAGAAVGLSQADLNQSLREVQHQYRALRDVYDTHGIAAGLTETAIVAAGGALGTLVQPGAGTGLGATLAGGISERSLYADSWERTANGEAYRDGAGQKVSPGRDFARFLGLDQGTLPYTALSAISDGLFDLGADPLAHGLGVYKGFNASERAAGGLMGAIRGDTVLRSADDIDRLLEARPLTTRAAFQSMAAKDAAQIADEFPKFQSIAKDLGDAQSVDEVADVFRDALQGPELLGHALPTKLNYDQPRLALPNLDGVDAQLATLGPEYRPIGRIRGFVRRASTKIPMNVNPDTLEFSATRIDPARNDNYGAVRAALKFGNLNDRVVDGVMNDYINAVDTGQRRLIFRNAMVRSLLSTGIADDSQLVSRARQEVADIMGGISGAEGAHYGYDIAGGDLSRLVVDSGGETTAAIYAGQRGDLALPEFKAWTRAIREAQGAKALFGRLDDWAFRRVTVPFKALNLLTGGFALRVATAELIPAVLRNGVLDTIRASAAARAANYGEILADDEIGHIQAAVVKMLRGPAEFVAKPEDIELATDLIMQNQGHVVAPAVRAGDYVANDAIGKLEADRHNIYALITDHPNTSRESGRFEGILSGVEDQPLYWQRAIREAVGDEGARIHAAAYRDAYLSAGRETVEADRAGGFIETTSREAPTDLPFNEGDRLAIHDIEFNRAKERGLSDTAAEQVAGEKADAAAIKAFIPTAEEAAGGRTAKYTDDELVKIATRAAIKADEHYLRNIMDPAELTDFTRSLRASNPDADPILEFARTRVEATKGLSHAPVRDAAGNVVGRPHIDILNDIANGTTTPVERLKGINVGDRPLTVKGRVREPELPGSMIERLANVGFHRVLDPIINTVGREHQYLLSVKRFMADYDGMIAAGQITRDEALMHSQTKAIQDVVRFIHNPSERTQFSVLTRNLAPFWFAQEQSYRRVGRLLSTDPKAFRRYQIMIGAFTNYVHEQHDEQGMAHFVIPGLGWLDETAIAAMASAGLPIAGAVPTQVLGNVNSLQTVFPFSEGLRPSWSVFVTVPAHIVEGLFPELREPVTSFIGEAANAGSTWDALIPSTPVRNLVKAFVDGPTMTSGMTSTFQALAYKQNVEMEKWVEKGGDPSSPNAPHLIPAADASPLERKEFIEKLRNQTRINIMFRAIFSAVSPTAPSIDVGDYGIKEEVQRSIDKYGYFDGVQRYLDKNPNATPYTITKSKSANDAPAIAPIKSAQQFVDNNLALFRQYPAAAGYLIPQDANGAYDSAAYQEQIALGLRERKNFKDFSEDFYVNEGFAQYDADKQAHDAAIADLTAQDDTDGITAENSSWSDYLENGLGKQNPVWWDYFTSQDRENRRSNEIAQLRELITLPRVRKTAQVRGIIDLLGDLDTHLAALDNGRLDGWSRDERQAEIDSWQAYLDSVSQQRPDLELVISRLLAHEGAR